MGSTAGGNVSLDRMTHLLLFTVDFDFQGKEAEYCLPVSAVNFCDWSFHGNSTYRQCVCVYVYVYVYVYVSVYDGSVLSKITSDAGNRFRRKAIIAVQFKMVSMRSKKPICALSNLSKCSLHQCRDCTHNRHLNDTTITLC